MIQAARFTAASCIRAQRWLAPTLVYAVALAATFAGGGRPLTNLSLGAAALFPVTAWLAVAALNDEDDDHAVITATIVGGVRRLRLVKVAIAAGAGFALAAAGVGFAYWRTASSFASADLAAGVTADVAMVAGGLVAGALCARPFVSRSGTALLLICGATIADLVAPHAPLRLMLVALDGDGPQWRMLLESAGVTLAAALLVATATLVPTERLTGQPGRRAPRTESEQMRP